MLGRADELRTLRARVNERARLITIFGLGGMGKTTLARALMESTGGAVFVPLAAAVDRDQALALVARALEVGADRSGQLEPRLQARFARGALLVLDNVEHLECAAEMIDRWTDSAPRLNVVATSRARLGLPYESVIEVGSLALPDGESDCLASPAVQLFLERAGMRAPSAADLDAIERIVRALDGVPLAIELAAGRARDLPLTTLAAGAADVRWLTGEARAGLSRHRSIDELMEWSWSLLDEPSREALVELSAFRGGLAPELAGELGPLLRSLCARALVTIVDGRYELLEIVRAFVEARADTRAARQRHASLFALEAERRGVLGPGWAHERDWLRAELENLAAAASSSAGSELALPTALALDVALSASWLPRGPAMLEAALERGAHAFAVARLAECRWIRGELDAELAERAWDLAQRANDSELETVAGAVWLLHLGSVGQASQHVDLARRLVEGARSVETAIQDDLRAAIMYALPAAEMVRACEQWVELALHTADEGYELCLLAFALASSGHGERALAVVPPSGPTADYARACAFVACQRWAEAAAAFERAREIERSAGRARYATWNAIGAATSRCLAGERERGRAELDALSDELEGLGAEAFPSILHAALVGGERARAQLAALRASGAFAAFALELDAMDALEAKDFARAGERARALELRLAELPATDAFAAMFTHRILRTRLAAEPQRRSLVVGPAAAWFRLSDGETVSLDAHHSARRLLEALLEGEHDAEALFAAGWPGDRAARASAHNRVRVTLARLRKLGLEGAIERGAQGWRLMADLDVVRSPSTV